MRCNKFTMKWPFYLISGNCAAHHNGLQLDYVAPGRMPAALPPGNRSNRSRTEVSLIFYSFSNRLALAIFLFLITNSPAWS